MFTAEGSLGFWKSLLFFSISSCLRELRALTLHPSLHVATQCKHAHVNAYNTDTAIIGSKAWLDGHNLTSI